MKYFAYLFVTKNPVNAIAIFSEKASKKALYRKVKKASRKILQHIQEKTKFYYVTPFEINIIGENIPSLDFTSKYLDNLPAINYLENHLNINTGLLLCNINILTDNKFIGRINYTDEYAILKLVNLYRKHGIVQRKNLVYDDKFIRNYEIIIILLLKAKFGALLADMIYSFIPSEFESYIMDINVIKT